MSWLNDALSGAASGGGLGLAFGPQAGAIGAGLGGLAGALGLGKAKKPKINQLPIYSDEQTGLINSLVQGTSPLNQDALNYIQQILSGDPQALQSFEQPYLDQYNEQIVPGIAERFSGLGAQRSSAFNQAMAQGARGLSTDLASLRSGLKNQALNQLNQMNQTALTRTTSPYLEEGEDSIFNSLMPGAADIITEYAKNYIRNKSSGLGSLNSGGLNRNPMQHNFWS